MRSASNESAARLAGIKVWAVLIFVYGVSGLLDRELGGAMQAARLLCCQMGCSSAQVLTSSHAITAVILVSHLLRRRYRFDLGNAGRGSDHCRFVRMASILTRCFRRDGNKVIQGSGDLIRRQCDSYRLFGCRARPAL